MTLSMADFYPEQNTAITHVTNKESETSQKITFNTSELSDIEQIKIYLKLHLTEAQIATKLNCARETVSRKIGKWMQTPDFDEWLNTVWLELLNDLSIETETKIEVFRQLTRLKVAQTTKRSEIKAEIKEIKLEWNLEYNPANTVHTAPKADGVSPEQSKV
jgi:hypothetical protein